MADIDPQLVSDVLGFKKAKRAAIGRSVAAGVLGTLGADTSALNRPHDTPQEFELKKLELKRDLIKSWRAASAAGGDDESKMAKAQFDFISDIVGKLLTHAGVDEQAQASIRSSFNTNATRLATQKATDKLKLEMAGSANGTALRDAINRFYAQTASGANAGVLSNKALLRVLVQVVAEQTGWASDIGGASPASQAGATATMYKALACANSIMQSNADPDSAHSLDELFAANTADPNVAKLKQVWDAAKATRAYADVQATVEAENSAAAQETLGQLYNSVPNTAKAAIEQAKSIIQLYGISGKGPDDVSDAVDKAVGNTPPAGNTRGAELSPNAQKLNSWAAQQGLAPLVTPPKAEGETTNYGLLKSALDEIDQMSPTLGPSSLKAQILQSGQFADWMKQRGLNPAAPEVGWNALKGEVGELHRKAAQENRSILRSKAAGGAPAQAPVTPPDSGNAATAPAPEAPSKGDGTPTFVVGPDGHPWYHAANGSELRPATPSELTKLDLDLEAKVPNALLPASEFERLKADTVAAMDARRAKRTEVATLQPPPGPALAPPDTRPPAGPDSFIPALQRSFADRKREFQRQAMFGERPLHTEGTRQLPSGELAPGLAGDEEQHPPYETSMMGPSSVKVPLPSYPGTGRLPNDPNPNRVYPVRDVDHDALQKAFDAHDNAEVRRLLGLPPLEEASP